MSSFVLNNSEFSSEYLNLIIPNMAIFDVDNKDEKIIMEKANNFYIKNNLNLRIYKTRNGFRIFITNNKFGLYKHENILKIYCKQIDADVRYLNILQENFLNHFTARISPKYLSRIKNPCSINDFYKKYNEYKQKNESIALYLTSVGTGKILDEFKDFIEVHDQEVKAFNKNFILV